MDIVITQHALNRLRERNCHNEIGKGVDEEAFIRKMLDGAIEIEFSKEHKIKRLLSNDFTDSRYFYNNGLIFVCTDTTPMSLVTVESQGVRKFGKDLFKKDNKKN